MKNGFSIIIPFHGQYKLVRDCLESVLLATYGVPYEVCLVDDCSKNTFFLQEIRKTVGLDILGVQLKEHKGFGAALKAGFEATSNPWVVFLNSDTKIVESNWLLEMYKTMQKLSSDKVKLVSARTDNPPGDNPLLKTERLYRESEDIIVKEALPLFCALAPRSLFDRIGFIKEYQYGFYEDEEFFWRMKKRGYQQAISAKAWVHHENGATVNYVIKEIPEAQKIMFEDNRNRCLADLKEK